MKKALEVIKRNETQIILIALSFISINTFIFYFLNGKNLLYADAISRLDIARKVIDNITPGLPQVGNVWLPLPQLLMLPFIWNNTLWHTGIAGYFMSGLSFLLCSFFIYKSAILITKSRLAGLFSLVIFALNINILYLQTTAMSESIFMASLSAVIYFFLKWFHTKNKKYLVLAAFSVSTLTLIRYEGLAILLSSIPLVFIYSWILERKKVEAEGNTIIYATLACLGFVLWTLYLTAIFGDPLFWKNYYATPQATGGAVAAYSQAKPFISAVWQYFTAFSWMMGLIPVVFLILGIISMVIICIKKKSWDFLVLLMPLSIFLFMVLTLQRNTPIVQPALSIRNIMSGETSLQTGFNIRYGILLLPWTAIICSYLLIFKNKIVNATLFVIFLTIFGLQIYTYFVPIYTVIYKIPDKIYPKPDAELVAYMKNNYDNGKILISAGSKEDQMFQMGFSYKTYIHEGTGKYWKESVNNPSRYAKWVIIDSGSNSDNLARKMNRKDILSREYRLVFQEGQIKVYKKIGKPYYDI